MAARAKRLSLGSVLTETARVVLRRPLLFVLTSLAFGYLSPLLYTATSALVGQQGGLADAWRAPGAFSALLFIRMLAGAAGIVVITGAALAAAEGAATSLETHLRDLRQHYWAAFGILLIIGIGGTVASFMPSWLMITLSVGWSLATYGWLCATSVRLRERRGVRASLGRSASLIRRDGRAGFLFVLLMETLFWLLMLTIRRDFLDPAPTPRPFADWLFQPLLDACMVLMGTAAPAVLYLRLAEGAEAPEARVFA